MSQMNGLMFSKELDYTDHALQRMDERHITTFDVENCLIHGKEFRKGLFKYGSLVVSYKNDVVVTAFKRQPQKKQVKSHTFSEWPWKKQYNLMCNKLIIL